jgi:ubiquinone/menaquinone biosynthesis C-methylase UbiE
MSEMNPVARFFVNLANRRRSARVLSSLGTALDLPPQSRILELGAGRGGLSLLLYRRFRPARLVVTDFDPHQVEEARRFLSGELDPLPPAIQTCEVDALQLPFPDGTFDCVFAILMLHHVEATHFEYRRRPAALQEIRRVLVPGGRLVYSEFSRVDDLHRTLGELGFAVRFAKRNWRRTELALYMAPT